MNDEDQDLEKVQAALDVLGEHFDSVQIFCTRHEMGTDNGTVSLSRGIGNWFARRGQIIHWLTKCDEENRIEARSDNSD